MVSIKDNKIYYDNYDWLHSGEQWANRWGGTDVQWYGTVLPRIHSFLPASSILEIGPGHGRLAQYLEPYCDQLVLVDMTEACIEACRNRFAGNGKVECLLNDGLDLTGAGTSNVEFAFSFFSLVHADKATLQSYLHELERVLTQDGVAFIHHSNAADCITGDPDDDEVLNKYRDASVSAAGVVKMATEAGLSCRSQELFGWDTAKLLTDCFSVIVRPDSRNAKQNAVICNWDFPFEVEKLNQLAQAYANISHSA